MLYKTVGRYFTLLKKFFREVFKAKKGKAKIVMRTKEEHREYMKKWRQKQKLAQNLQNSPELPVFVPSNGVTSTKATNDINQNCDISPTRKFINIYMFHPIKKNHIYLIECSGKTIVFLKSQGFEVRRKKER